MKNVAVGGRGGVRGRTARRARPAARGQSGSIGIARSSLLPALLAALVLAGCGADLTTDAPDRQRTVTVETGPGGGATAAAGDPADVPGVDSCDGAREPTTADNLREAEIAIRCLTNAAREKQGLAALDFSERLARAAATRSSDMAEQDYFGHQGPDGGNVERAAERAGYLDGAQAYRLGENIGWAGEGRATPAQMVRGWLDSPTHRRNIMDERFTHIGIGAVAGVPRPDADPGATYTQIFGAKGDAARRGS